MNRSRCVAFRFEYPDAWRSITGVLRALYTRSEGRRDWHCHFAAREPYSDYHVTVQWDRKFIGKCVWNIRTYKFNMYANICLLTRLKSKVSLCFSFTIDIYWISLKFNLIKSRIEFFSKFVKLKEGIEKRSSFSNADYNSDSGGPICWFLKEAEECCG